MKNIIVIKIGSSILLTERNKLDEFRIAHIADQILTLKEKRYGIILVVSGAVACGINLLKISTLDTTHRQVAAGAGQAYLTSVFFEVFSKKHLQMAQVLLTKDLLQSEEKNIRIKSIIEYYLQSGIISVLNENDVIDLNCFGGNDYLAAEVTKLVDAKQLLILSTMDGSKYGIGGGKTKLETIDILKRNNILSKIVDGKIKNIILKNII